MIIINAYDYDKPMPSGVEEQIGRVMHKRAKREGHRSKMPDDKRMKSTPEYFASRQEDVISYITNNGASTAVEIAQHLKASPSAVGGYLREIRKKRIVSYSKPHPNKPAKWAMQGEKKNTGRKPFIMDAVLEVLKDGRRRTPPQIAAIINADGSPIRRALRQLHAEGKVNREEFNSKHVEWWI